MLLAEGHAYAFDYPLARLWSEASIVKRRMGARVADDGLVTHGAFLAVMAGQPRTATQAFNKLLTRMRRGG